MVASSACLNRGKRVVGVFMTRTITIFQLSDRIVDRAWRGGFLVRSRLVLLRVAPGAIRLIGRTTFMGRSRNHLIIRDMAQLAIRIDRHAQAWVRFVIGGDVHVRLDRPPHRGVMALFASLRSNEVRRRFWRCKI